MSSLSLSFQRGLLIGQEKFLREFDFVQTSCRSNEPKLFNAIDLLCQTPPPPPTRNNLHIHLIIIFYKIMHCPTCSKYFQVICLEEAANTHNLHLFMALMFCENNNYVELADKWSNSLGSILPEKLGGAAWPASPKRLPYLWPINFFSLP